MFYYPPHSHLPRDGVFDTYIQEHARHVKSFMLIFMLILYAYHRFLLSSTGQDKFTSSRPIFRAQDLTYLGVQK